LEYTSLQNNKIKKKEQYEKSILVARQIGATAAYADRITKALNIAYVNTFQFIEVFD